MCERNHRASFLLLYFYFFRFKNIQRIACLQGKWANSTWIQATSQTLHIRTTHLITFSDIHPPILMLMPTSSSSLLIHEFWSRNMCHHHDGVYICYEWQRQYFYVKLYFAHTLTVTASAQNENCKKRKVFSIYLIAICIFGACTHRTPAHKSLNSIYLAYVQVAAMGFAFY